MSGKHVPKNGGYAEKGDWGRFSWSMKPTGLGEGQFAKEAIAELVDSLAKPPIPGQNGWSFSLAMAET
jgi:hypothetical protein